MVPDLAAVVGSRLPPTPNARTRRAKAPGRAGESSASSAAWQECSIFASGLKAVLALYGNPYDATDAVALINDCFESGDMAGSGALWALRDHLPVAGLPQLLDGVVVPDRDRSGFDRPRWEVGSLHAHLVPAWEAPGAFDPEQALGWLRSF
jgi:hypothetical protein